MEYVREDPRGLRGRFGKVLSMKSFVSNGLEQFPCRRVHEQRGRMSRPRRRWRSPFKRRPNSSPINRAQLGAHHQ